MAYTVSLALPTRAMCCFTCSAVQVAGTPRNSVVIRPPAEVGGKFISVRIVSRVGGGEEVHQPRPPLVAQLTEQVHLLVGREGLDQRRRHLLVDPFEDLAPPLELRLVEQLHRQVERQRRHHPRRGLQRQAVERLGDVDRAEIGTRFDEVVLIAAEEIEKFWGEAGRGGHDGSPPWRWQVR